MNKHQLTNSLKVFIVALFISCVFNTASFAQSCHFGGTWNSNFGKMTLSQNGSQISGSLGSDKITGSVQGYILQGSYWAGSGYPADVVFYISPDCNKLNGEYTKGQSTQKWTATRVTHQPHPPSSPASSYSRQPDYVQKAGGYGLPTYSKKPAASSPSAWNGTWSTTSGTLRLAKTDATTVEGTYTQNHSKKGIIHGKIKGTISGNKLSCNWSEGPSFSAPRDAGQVVFTIAPNGNSFTGTWRYGYDMHYNNWSNNWSGTRISY